VKYLSVFIVLVAFLTTARAIADDGDTFLNPTNVPSPSEDADKWFNYRSSESVFETEKPAPPRNNVYTGTSDLKSLEGNAFLDSYSSPDSGSNSFLGMPETIDSMDSYSRELDEQAQATEQNNLFLGQDTDIEEGTYDFSSEYQRLSDKYWGNKKASQD